MTADSEPYCIVMSVSSPHLILSIHLTLALALSIPSTSMYHCFHLSGTPTLSYLIVCLPLTLPLWKGNGSWLYGSGQGYRLLSPYSLRVIKGNYWRCSEGDGEPLFFFLQCLEEERRSNFSRTLMTP